jgi:hypothetical protein
MGILCAAATSADSRMPHEHYLPDVVGDVPLAALAFAHPHSCLFLAEIVVRARRFCAAA